jgi:hypothetical protein
MAFTLTLAGVLLSHARARLVSLRRTSHRRLIVELARVVPFVTGYAIVLGGLAIASNNALRLF